MKLPSLNKLPYRLQTILSSSRRSNSAVPARRDALDAAVSYLLYAHSHSNDGGFPAFYDILEDHRAPSNPETSAYIIPTLLDYAKSANRPDARQVALTAADYLLKVQSPDGGITGGGADAPLSVFHTGQAMQGYLAAWRETGNPLFEEALKNAGRWLMRHQAKEGHWTAHSSGGHHKIRDVRVAWPLIEAGLVFDDMAMVEAGRRCLNWAVTRQNSDGWFEECSLEGKEPPDLHTIAYAIEGLLEGGILLREGRFIDAAQSAADALLERIRPDGSLDGFWDKGWNPVEPSSCQPGNAQIGLCWLRLFERTRNTRYRDAAGRIIDFVTTSQSFDEAEPVLYGAIAGSKPVWGKYLRWRYPVSANKFLIDAILVEESFSRPCPRKQG